MSLGTDFRTVSRRLSIRRRNRPMKRVLAVNAVVTYQIHESLAVDATIEKIEFDATVGLNGCELFFIRYFCDGLQFTSWVSGAVLR